MFARTDLNGLGDGWNIILSPMPFPIVILADADSGDFRIWGDDVGGGQSKIQHLEFALNAVWACKNGRYRLLQLLIEIADAVNRFEKTMEPGRQIVALQWRQHRLLQWFGQ